MTGLQLLKLLIPKILMQYIFPISISMRANGYALSGADTRMRYLTGSSTSNKYWYGQTAAGPTADTPNLSSAILMKNSSAGYAYTLTARIQKDIPELLC